MSVLWWSRDYTSPCFRLLALAGFLQSSRQTVSDINPPEATQRAYDGLVDPSAEQATQLVAAALPGWKTFVDELPQRLLDPSPEAEAWRQKILEGAAAVLGPEPLQDPGGG